MRKNLQFLALMMLVTGEAGLARASELSLRGGQPVDIKVRGVREHGLKLKATAAGWSFVADLPNDGSLCSADVRDVSALPAGMLLKWNERVSNQGAPAHVVLEPARYQATHTYRVTVRCGVREISRGVVWLAPDPSRTARGKNLITLSDAETSADIANPAEGDIAPIAKGAL